ncbi:MAG: hypothetical protein JKX85_16575, partial [Phycisphaeraceae bacterium]|nr:hypothetical protein [Phycisphaeraceae bacterium]
MITLKTKAQPMGLQIIDDPNAHCTMSKQFTYRIVWRPEKHYVAGTQFEVRSHCMRAFLTWRYTNFVMKAGDITFRQKVKPTVHEVFQNKERALFGARLSYGVRKGEPVEFEITAIAPIWAGLDNIISIWTIDAGRNTDQTAKKELHCQCCLSVVAGPVERLSVYSRPMPGADNRV